MNGRTRISESSSQKTHIFSTEKFSYGDWQWFDTDLSIHEEEDIPGDEESFSLEKDPLGI